MYLDGEFFLHGPFLDKLDEYESGLHVNKVNLQQATTSPTYTPSTTCTNMPVSNVVTSPGVQTAGK